jgi:hypothetical protein
MNLNKVVALPFPAITNRKPRTVKTFNVFSKCPYWNNAEHTALYLSRFGLMTGVFIMQKTQLESMEKDILKHQSYWMHMQLNCHEVKKIRHSWKYLMKMRTLYEYNANRSAKYVYLVVKSPNLPVPTKLSCNHQKCHPEKKNSNIMKCTLNSWLSLRK